MLSLRTAGAAAAVALTAGAASAGSVSFSDSIPFQPTNWNGSLTVPKFNPALGTLQSISITLTGQVRGDAKFESLDAQPATVTMNLQATLTLTRPDSSVIAQVLPVVNTVDNVTAFDGVIDFGGTSGKTYNNLMSSMMTTVVSPPPISDLALFTASFAGETISLPVTALGTSNGSGAGNLLLQFSTEAAARVRVTYTFDGGVVPLPSAAGMGFAGLLAVAARRRRA